MRDALEKGNIEYRSLGVRQIYAAPPWGGTPSPIDRNYPNLSWTDINNLEAIRNSIEARANSPTD